MSELAGVEDAAAQFTDSTAATFAGAWTVVPELSLHLTAAADVPVRGSIAQLGVAVGRRW